MNNARARLEPQVLVAVQRAPVASQPIVSVAHNELAGTPIGTVARNDVADVMVMNDAGVMLRIWRAIDITSIATTTSISPTRWYETPYARSRSRSSSERRCRLPR